MGYIKLDRKLFKNFLWESNEPFSKRDAWIDLIQLANYKDTKEYYKGKMIQRERGTVYCSYVWLSNRWKWSRGKVIRYIEMLKNEKMCSVNSTPDGTSITIENYTFYQDGGTTDRTPHSTSDGTTDGTHKKKDKERINKENIYVVQILDYLNQVTGKSYSPKTEAYKQLINARINEGYTVDDFIKVIDNKYAEWRDTEYEKYLRPKTLFAKSHFDDYLNTTITRRSNNPFADLLEEYERTQQPL